MSLFSKKEVMKLDVTGMHCEKCVARVKAALEGVGAVCRRAIAFIDVHDRWQFHAEVGDGPIFHIMIAVAEELLPLRIHLHHAQSVAAKNIL